MQYRLFVFTVSLFLGFPLCAESALSADEQASEVAQDCHGRIAGFDFAGNETSQDRLLIKRSRLSLGQSFNAQTLLDAQQNLMDTALFKSVKVVPANGCHDESRVLIEVDERYYHIIYPRGKRNGDGDISLGLRYRGSNLFGLEQRMIIGLTESRFANGETAQSALFSYDMPLIDSPYEYRWLLRDTQTFLDPDADRVAASGQVLTSAQIADLPAVVRRDEEAQFWVGRQWHATFLERPAMVLANVSTMQTQIDGDQRFTHIQGGDFNSLGLRLEYDAVHEQTYRRYGHFFALDWSRGMGFFGSDYAASVISAEFRHYRRLNAFDNLNTRAYVAMSTEQTFNDPRFAIGGNGSLRGLESDYQEGDHIWVFNVDYIVGLQDHPTWRATLFSDVGKVFERYDQLNTQGWQWTLGAGLRWKIKSFVKTDLVFDYGYSPQTGYAKLYFSTSLPF